MHERKWSAWLHLASGDGGLVRVDGHAEDVVVMAQEEALQEGRGQSHRAAASESECLRSLSLMPICSARVQLLVRAMAQNHKQQALSKP